MNEIKVGLFTVSGIIIFIAMFFIIGDISMEPKLFCEVEFPDALGIKAGEKVYLSGLRIGEVTGISYSPPEKRVYLSLECNEGSKWPETSEFTIDTMGLMGEKFVGIKPLEGYFLRLEDLEYDKQPSDDTLLGQTNSGTNKKVEKTRGLKDLYHNEEIMLGFFENSSSENSNLYSKEYFVGRIRRINGTDNILAVFNRDIEQKMARKMEISQNQLRAEIVLTRYLPGKKISFNCSVKRSTPEFYIDIAGIHRSVKKGALIHIVASGDSQGIVGFVTRHPRIKYKDSSWFFLKRKKIACTRVVVSLETSKFNDFNKQSVNSDAIKYYNNLATTVSATFSDNIKLRIRDDNEKEQDFKVMEQGLFFYGTSLVTMGDLMKTGRDVLRKVHSGIETADRLLGHVNNLFESGDLKDRFIRIADNVETGSSGLMDAAVDAKSLITDLRNTVSSVDRAVKNAGDTLVSFQNDMSKISSGVGDAAKEIGSLAKNGKKGMDTLLKEAQKLSGRIKGIFDRNDTKISDTLDNFRGASLGFNKLATNLSSALNEDDTRDLVKNISQSVSRVKKTMDQASSMVESIEKTEFTLRASLYHNKENQDVTGDIMARVLPGNSPGIFTLGAQDIGRHGQARLSYGRSFNRSGTLFGHLGVFESRFGLGLDFNISRYISIAFEALDPERFRYNASLSFGSGFEKIFTLRLRDFNSEVNKREIQIGINSYF